MAEADFRVTPEELKKKMQEALDNISSAKGKLNEYGDVAKSTVACWTGEAGEKYRQMFDKFKPDMESILKEWNDHAIKLGTIAGVYEESEKTNAEGAKGLPDDVIS